MISRVGERSLAAAPVLLHDSPRSRGPSRVRWRENRPPLAIPSSGSATCPFTVSFRASCTRLPGFWADGLPSRSPRQFGVGRTSGHPRPRCPLTRVRREALPSGRDGYLITAMSSRQYIDDGAKLAAALAMLSGVATGTFGVIQSVGRPASIDPPTLSGVFPKTNKLLNEDLRWASRLAVTGSIDLNL